MIFETRLYSIDDRLIRQNSRAAIYHNCNGDTKPTSMMSRIRSNVNIRIIYVILSIMAVLYCITLFLLISKKFFAQETKFISIAVVGGTDTKTQNHIAAILGSRGIQNYTMGSAVEGVFVPQQDANRAKAILQEDAKQGSYWIDFRTEQEILGARRAARNDSGPGKQ